METEKKDKVQRKYIVGFALLLLFFVVLTFYFWDKTKQLKKSSGEIEAQEIADIVLKVSEIMLLPQGETPTLATVSDPEKLKDQPFFLNAKVGFKVLIYTKAEKAILYDPFEHLIIEVAPIKMGADDLE